MVYMSKGRAPGLPLLLGMLWLGSGIAGATTFLTLQSTYLGDGWFQYQMNVLNDPFFTAVQVSGFGVNFTNETDQGTLPDGWTAYTNGTANWSGPDTYPPRPYELTVLVQSSDTSYRLGAGTNFDGAIVLFSLFLSELCPGMADGTVSANLVGYAMMPGLVPCSPDEADGSPTNYVYALKLLPDVNINQLIQTNGLIYGVDFTWDSDSTFVLQGTADFYNWTNIAYLWSYPPETVWTTNTPLNPYGQLFRVALVADGYDTNLPPLTSSLALKPQASTVASPTTTTPHVTGCQIAGGKVMVNIASQSGQTVQVQVLDSHQVVRQTRELTATGASATVSFDAASLPSPVFFQAVAVPSSESF